MLDGSGRELEEDEEGFKESKLLKNDSEEDLSKNYVTASMSGLINSDQGVDLEDTSVDVSVLESSEWPEDGVSSDICLKIFFLNTS